MSVISDTSKLLITTTIQSARLASKDVTIVRYPIPVLPADSDISGSIKLCVARSVTILNSTTTIPMGVLNY